MSISQLHSPRAQKLPVLRRTSPAPRLAPNTHRHRGSHAQHHHDTVESKNGAKTSSVDEILQRLRDGEIDARGADGEDNDDFAGDLSDSLVSRSYEP